MTKRLHSAQRHFLIGPRRFGKSSILDAARERASASGTPTLLVNAETFTSLDALAGGIAAAAGQLFAGTVRERIRRVGEWFSAIKPQVEYDPITDGLKVSVTTEAGRPSEASSIVAVLDALDREAASRKVVVGVMIDEFQVVSLRGGLVAEQQLRSAVQTHRHLGYAFAGSDTRMLHAMINQHSRPFYRMGDTQFLGPVPRAEFQTFIAGVFAGGGAEIEDEGYHAIFDLAEDVPYNVQRLCAEVHEEYLAGSIGAHISAADVGGVLDLIIRQGHANYLALYLTLSNQQQRVVAGLARDRDRDGPVSLLARRIKVAASTLRRARASLLDSGILREDYAGGSEIRYRFVDPFFARWLNGFVAA